MAFEKVGALGDLIAGLPKRVEVGGEPICLVRVGDEVRAMHDTCSHEDFSLSEGIVFDGELECSLHGSMFDLGDGRPSSLPATKPVPVFACKVDGDDVLVDLDQNLNGAPIPDHD